MNPTRKTRTNCVNGIGIGETPDPAIRTAPTADPAKTPTPAQAYEAFCTLNHEYAVALAEGLPLRRLTQRRRKAWQAYRKAKLEEAKQVTVSPMKRADASPARRAPTQASPA
jgi:hypothetical protein